MTPQPVKKRPSKWVIIGSVIALLVVLVLLAVLLFAERSDAPSPQTEAGQTTEQPEPKTSIRMLATGDWIAHDAINAAAELNGEYSYSDMTDMMKPYFDESDINFCNLATPAGGEQFGVSGYPIFNAPLAWNRDMHDLGCNLINTGTNHTNDKGQAGIDAELNEWDGYENVLAHAGANRNTEEMNTVEYFEMDGVKFAFLSYSTYSNLPNPELYSLTRFNEPLVTNQMNEARSQADVVIVSMRWGTEYSSSINAAQERDAQKLADLGADVVLGHGQHVLGPVKRLAGQGGRETIVWYGLGNFLNAQLETEALTGCVAQFDIDIATKKVSQNSCLPFYQHYEWTAADKAAGRLLNRSNFDIMPLFDAAEYLVRPNAHLDTAVQTQMERIRGIVSTYTEVPIQNATDL